MVFIWDMAESVHLLEELQYLHDDITGLYNQRGFAFLADNKIHEAIRLQQQIAVLLFDIEGTEQINRRFGHAEGNLAISTVGRLLRATYRASDLIGHICSDKFAVLGMLLGDPPMELLTNRFLVRLQTYNDQESKPYRLNVKINHRKYRSNTDQRQLDIIHYIAIQNSVTGLSQMMYHSGR